MSRHLIIAVATLFCSGTLAFADAPGRYTTISTVILVAEDIDDYLDTSVEEYPTFQNEALSFVDDVDFTDNESAKVFELSSSNWFAQYDANRRDDLTPELGERLAELESEINLHVDELIAMPSATDLRASQDRQSSLSDWQSNMSGQWETPQQQAKDPNLSTPVIAATKPSSNRAQNAGIWMFLCIMIASFAWLGWAEYRDLKARSYRSRRQDAELEPQAETSEPCETKSRFMEAARERETVADAEEEIEFSEISSDTFEGETEADDDCNFEIGVLEEANTLLASVGNLKVNTDEVPQEEFADTFDRESDELGNETAGDLISLRGVGPATRDYLVSQGIRNLTDLIAADTERLQEILNEAGSRFQAAQPAKWVEQAREMLSVAQ